MLPLAYDGSTRKDVISRHIEGSTMEELDTTTKDCLNIQHTTNVEIETEQRRHDQRSQHCGF